jgi:predicted GIY-YIG superfamily endonuclease
MKKGYIYYIRNTVDGKWYVGSTTNKNRLSQHRHALNKNDHWNKHLQRAWNKYGKKAFLLRIEKEFDTETECRDYEDDILKEYVGKTECYNQCKSRYGNKWEPSTIEKLREYAYKGYEGAVKKYGEKEYKRMQSEYGRKGALKRGPMKHTQDTKDKLSKINKGVKRKLSPEGLQKLRESAAKAREKRWTKT